MAVMYAIFVIGIVVVVIAGVVLWRFEPVASGPAQRLLQPLGRIRDTCRQELGRHGGALVVLLASAAAAVIVSWPFGRFARRYEPNIDQPFLHWTQRHVRHHGLFHHANSVLTLMGDLPEVKIISLVAAVGFGIAWTVQRRGWWIPTLVVAAAFGFEKFGAMALSRVVDRHKVNLPDFGTYPSGGCARVIVTYGIVFYLVLLTWPQIRRVWRITGWTVVGILAFVEGFTRVYLIKHWMMDVVGGWLYGTLMLLALVVAASCFRREAQALPDQRAPGGSRDTQLVRR